jgi:TRAP-type C4-dicarboxylate transport system permease small subunit
MINAVNGPGRGTQGGLRMGFYSKLSHLIIGIFLVIGAIALMAMMVIVVSNCLGRAFFRTPIWGTIEIAGLAGVIVVAAAVGFAEWEHRHIVVDVVTNRLTPRIRAIADIFTLFLSLGAIGFMLWAIFNDALNALEIREITLTTGVITAPFKFTWAIGIIILFLFLLQHLVEALRKGEKK